MGYFGSFGDTTVLGTLPAGATPPPGAPPPAGMQYPGSTAIPGTVPGGSPGYPSTMPGGFQVGLSIPQTVGGQPVIDIHPAAWPYDPLVSRLFQLDTTGAIAAPQNQLDQFRAICLTALIENKLIQPGNPSAASAGIDTLSQVFAWYMAGGGDTTLAQQPDFLRILHESFYEYIYPILYRDVYAASTYALYAKNKAAGLTLSGKKIFKAQVGGHAGQIVYTGPPPGTPGAPPPAAAASGNTMLILGALAVAGGAAYLLL